MILVIFIFLQDWRTTIIPAVTIPVSLIGTFAFVKLFGFSLNSLTLFGLTLATGMVVDDAIVVAEDVTRLIQEKGLSPIKATAEAMRELFSSVIASGIVLMAVFIPVGFLPGTAGQMYKQFALTITFSIAISTFNALTLTPALSVLLLRPHPQPRGLLGWLSKRINGFLNSLRWGYRRSLQVLTRFKQVVMVLFIASLVLTVGLYPSYVTLGEVKLFLNAENLSQRALGHIRLIVECFQISEISCICQDFDSVQVSPFLTKFTFPKVIKEGYSVS